MIFRAIDCDSLCILSGKYCWSITIEISLINNDGNLVDAFNYAALLSLSRFKLPFVTVESGKVKIWKPDEKRPQTLSIHHFPICLTFCLMEFEEEEKIKEYLAIDPTVFLFFKKEIGRRLF